jgi:hypothetical protein
MDLDLDGDRSGVGLQRLRMAARRVADERRILEQEARHRDGCHAAVGAAGRGHGADDVDLDMIQPPNTSPWMLASAGIGITRTTGTPSGRVVRSVMARSWGGYGDDGKARREPGSVPGRDRPQRTIKAMYSALSMSECAAIPQEGDPFADSCLGTKPNWPVIASRASGAAGKPSP